MAQSADVRDSIRWHSAVPMHRASLAALPEEILVALSDWMGVTKRASRTGTYSKAITLLFVEGGVHLFQPL